MERCSLEEGGVRSPVDIYNHGRDGRMPKGIGRRDFGEIRDIIVKYP